MLDLYARGRSSLFAIVDCNNFYISCERVFNPKLKNVPVVVLSNNDGCIISRSDEAKKLGIKMGEPYFKAQPIIKGNNVHVFSSNYTLYADMSMRVMDVISRFSSEVEIYSIDEAFIGLTAIKNLSVEAYVKQIKDAVYKYTGIPVSIGVASTKTLAKVANLMAKKSGGIFLLSNDIREDVLRDLDISHVWGIGRQLATLFKSNGIYTCLQLANSNDTLIRKSTNICTLKTVYELRGISCIELELIPQGKKSITVSRSFGQTINNFEELKQAALTFTTTAAEKLRAEKKVAQHISIFVHTNKYSKREEYYANSTSVTLETPTDQTPELMQHVRLHLKSIYRPGQQ